MGSFKKWFEEVTVGSTGQNPLPTQTAQNAGEIAKTYLADKRNAPTVGKLTSAIGSHPSMAKGLVMKAATDALKGFGAPDQVKVTMPIVGGHIFQSVVPPVKQNLNPFPVTPV